MALRGKGADRRFPALDEMVQLIALAILTLAALFVMGKVFLP